MQFERDGYLIVRNVLDQNTVTELTQACDALVASDKMLGRFRNDRGYDGFRNVVTLTPEILPLLTLPQTFGRVLQLMSPNLQLHTSHLIYKTPTERDNTDSRDPGWHRDINTLPSDLGHHAEPRAEIKVAFQLSDASQPGMGQTVVARGSNRLKETLERGDDGDPTELVEPLLAPGDAFLFENRTWHAGGHNTAGVTRKTLMLGYSYRWMRPDDYITHDQALLERCDPIQKQLLGGVGGLYREDGTFAPFGFDRPLNDWCKEHGIDSAWKKEPALAL